MRFLVIVHPGDMKSYESGEMPADELLQNMIRFNEELVDAGVMLAGEGLKLTSYAAKIHFSAGKTSEEQGPFKITDERVGGFWIWQVKSKQEAIDWAKRAPMEDGATLELREIFEPDDFSAEIAAKERELSEKMKAR